MSAIYKAGTYYGGGGASYPDGGTTGQALIKKSNLPDDVEWGDVDGLPAGGITGQVLIKRSNTDGDATWGEIQTIQISTLPTASVSLLGKVYQYIGMSDSTYTHGYFYECVSDGSSGYEWVNVEVQSIIGAQFTTMPTASADYVGEIHQYVGANTVSGAKLGAGTTTFRKGYFYECVNQSGTYSWQLAKVQETDVVKISKANFDLLSQAEKDCGKAYFIYDLDSFMGHTAFINPVGTIISFYGLIAPDGYLACDGTIYLREDYPALANHLVSQFPDLVGDGTTTFKVPDLQGEFLRGTGTNSNANQGSGANVGVHQNSTEIPWIYTYKGSGSEITMGFRPPKTANTRNSIKNYDAVTDTTSIEWANANGDSSGGTGTNGAMIGIRPTNTSVLYCIKY